MTKDRIKDLQKPTPWPRVTYQKLSRQGRDNDLQTTITDGSTQFTAIEMGKAHNVAEFLAQIDLIRLQIDKIEEYAKQIQHLHRKMLEPMADPKLALELDDKTADIKKLAYDVSTKLKKMEQTLEDQNENYKASAQWRMKESQIFNITLRFREVMNQYNQEFVLHRDRCKRAIVRELEITGSRRSDDELEEMLENGFPGTFHSTIMVDIEKAKQAVNEIEARHRDITKIENSIRELHSMFIDLAQLVAAQGQMIDNIEHSVSKAVEYVGGAAKDLDAAKKDHDAAVKKRFIIIIIVIAIVVILILITAAYFTTQKNLLGK